VPVTWQAAKRPERRESPENQTVGLLSLRDVQIEPALSNKTYGPRPLPPSVEMDPVRMHNKREVSGNSCRKQQANAAASPPIDHLKAV